MKLYFCGSCPKELKPHEVWKTRRIGRTLIAFCSLACYLKAAPKR